MADLAVFLAALGIAVLEFAEAAAVGLTLYADSRRYSAFGYVALGSVAVLVPTLLVGGLIALLPISLVRFVGGVLLLYFGLRLIKSARKSVLRVRVGAATPPEHRERGLMSSGFSVGAIEAFEAGIVLVGLLPNDYASTVLGLVVGVGIVLVATYVLRNHVRRIKQANMKVAVSALLLSFAVFWFGEVFVAWTDLVLIPLFLSFFAVVHAIANRRSPLAVAKAEQNTI